MIWIRDISFAPIIWGFVFGTCCIIENRKVWKTFNIGFWANAICVVFGCVHYCFYDCKAVGLFVITEGIFMILSNYEFDKGSYNKSTDPTLKLSRIECFLWMIGYVIYGICLLIGFEI